jgi:alanyl-tRNA synthetase
MLVELHMTKKIFWEDPYLTELETTIKSIDGNHITVYETIFYAFSGGQESDQGTIGGYQVLEAKKQDKKIFYTIDANHNLKIGDKVKIVINWERRYQLMRLHFAAEVVLELVCKRFPAIKKVGAHIAQDKSRIDFEWDQNISQFIAELQQNAQQIIDSNHPIVSAFSDEANEKRYWKINEFSQVPCGGTHIRKTGEMGLIRLKRVNPGKGRERIEIYVS